MCTQNPLRAGAPAIPRKFRKANSLHVLYSSHHRTNTDVPYAPIAADQNTSLDCYWAQVIPSAIVYLYSGITHIPSRA